MTFLKNKREWKNWVKTDRVESADIPKVFPCFAYEYVADWGMEWTGANYLYPDDIAEMATKMLHETGEAQST